MNTPSGNVSTRLDTYLERCQWQTSYSMEVNADQNLSYDALVNTPVDNMLARMLITARGMKSEGTVKEFFLHNGFILLEESRPEHLIVGLISQPWRIGGGLVECDGSSTWNSTRQTDHAKAVAIFGTEKIAAGRSRIYTETRIFIEDSAARRKFAAYWFLVKPWSNLIRRSWMNDAKMIAERSQLMSARG